MNGLLFELDAGGAAYKPGGGAWGDNSDIRIKDVVRDYDHGLAEIEQLRPVVYKFKGNETDTYPSNNPDALTNPASVTAPQPGATPPYRNSGHYRAAVEGKEFIGIIAQDCEAILPELVKRRAGFIDGHKVDDLRDLDPSALTFTLINAVKELSAKVAALEARVAQMG